MHIILIPFIKDELLNESSYFREDQFKICPSELIKESLVNKLSLLISQSTYYSISTNHLLHW
jgi:hypothetical protein